VAFLWRDRLLLAIQMIFTEREAATKRCTPMQVVWLMPDRDTRQAGVASGEIELGCIGSRCAQWRWYDVDAAPGRRGFCGLAGWVA
jgi:hypothetical protein